MNPHYTTGPLKFGVPATAALLLCAFVGCSGGDGGGAEDSGPARITAQPVDQTVSVGQSATFAVTVMGGLGHSYTWNKEGEPDPVGDSATYTTSPVTQADDGCFFQVLVTVGLAGNRSFPLYSGSAKLTVLPGFTPAPGTFTVTGALTTARYRHTATLLQDGRVLIAGGRDSGGELQSAELYSSTSGSFSPTGSLKSPRWGHTATLLANGKVLVAGGWRGDDVSATAMADAELYDPATGRFTSIAPLMTARAYHTATLLMDGRVLIAGGTDRSGSLISVLFAELFDPSTATFTATGALPGPSGYYEVVLRLPNGNVLFIGSQEMSPVNAETYDASTGTFSRHTLASAAPGSSRAGVILSDGTALLVGGTLRRFLSNSLRFNPVTGAALTQPAQIFGRRGSSATAPSSGKVLVFGGVGACRLNRAELYDPVTDTFNVTGGTVEERENHTATLLNNGSVLIVGGYNDNGLLANGVLFSP